MDCRIILRQGVEGQETDIHKYHVYKEKVYINFQSVKRKISLLTNLKMNFLKGSFQLNSGWNRYPVYHLLKRYQGNTNKYQYLPQYMKFHGECREKDNHLHELLLLPEQGEIICKILFSFLT